MTTPPDKLFRQGLEQFQKPAPGTAWERIESGLDRKRNRSPWMKIAAGLLILIVTSVVILQVNQTENALTTVSEKTAPVSSEKLSSSERSADPAKFKEIVAGEQVEVSSEQLAVSSHQSTDGNRESVGSREASGVRRESSANSKNPKSSRLQSTVYSLQSSTSTEETVLPDESHMATTTEPVEINIDPTSVTQVEITNEISISNVASNSKRTNITYTAEEVNAKYFKKESTPEATPEKKNTSGLQKVIDLALDLKNEGSVLGDIREKKNEWLSFNGPSNKRETNK